METNFEDAIKRIEVIISRLEDNDLDLETSIKLYQEGIELTSNAYKRINEVEKQAIKILEDSEINKLKESDISE